MAGIYSYFQRSFQRERKLPGSLCGEAVVDPDGVIVSFALRVDAGRIHAVTYRCTTCCTLVGLSEHLAELLTGMTLDQALAFDGQRLIELHPEIPAERQSRAWLAVWAAHSAVRQQFKGAIC